MIEGSLLEVFAWWPPCQPATLYLFLMRSVFMNVH